MQGSARKDVVFGAARVYTFTVPGPKWKSWSITNDAGTRRLARSVPRHLNEPRTKRAWILWKTAKDAVSTGSTPVVFFNEKRTDNEERSTQRHRPLNRIMPSHQNTVGRAA